MKRLTITLPDDLHVWLKDRAAQEQRTISNYLRVLAEAARQKEEHESTDQSARN